MGDFLVSRMAGFRILGLYGGCVVYCSALKGKGCPDYRTLPGLSVTGKPGFGRHPSEIVSI
jgi:hypothetical protein